LGPLLALAGGDWTATLLPGLGGAFASLAWQGHDVLMPLPLGADPTASFRGAFLMAPWANRLDGGRLPVMGTEYLVPINRPEDNTAIHGLSRDRPWSVAVAEPARAVLAQRIDTTEAGLPWRYDARLEVTLDAGGASIALALTNLADAAAPFGAGWHPFFARPPGTRLRFHAATLFPRDARCLPVAAQPSQGIDGDEAAYGGLDTHFAGWDGLAELRRPDFRLRLVASGALASNLQVFAPAASGGDGVLCVEPVSHLPDAPNRPELARFGPLAMLPPDAVLQGGVRLTAGAETPGTRPAA
jgi:aldose 1-epimerase